MSLAEKSVLTPRVRRKILRHAIKAYVKAEKEATILLSDGYPLMSAKMREQADAIFQRIEQFQ